MPRVTILGSGTCVPSTRRGPAGYVYESGEQSILVDSGSGTLGRLAHTAIDYRTLTAVAYTHTHADHTADLVPLLFALNHTPGFVRERPLKVLGPAGFSGFLAALDELFPGVAPRSYAVEVTEMPVAGFRLDSVSVAAHRVEHADLAALAYRFEADGTSVVFSGDTRYCRGIVDAARAADLLVLEASSPHDGDPGAHLNATLAGRVAREAGARRVVLTHQYPACDEHDMPALVGAHFEGEVLVGEDLMVLDVP